MFLRDIAYTNNCGIMHDIDGINISDVNYDRVCLNCIHWRVNVQLKGSADGVICSQGMGHTNPDDTCSMFSPNRSVDNQDLNRYFDKRNKFDVWK